MSDPAAGFELCSVVHLIRPTGARAHSLEELRAGIAAAPERSLFFHTRHCRLRHPVGHEITHDDFSAWAYGVVQDRETAERISFAVQSRSDSPEELRAALLEDLGRVPEAERGARAAAPEGEFVFLTTESVVLPTGVVVSTARETVHGLTGADLGVWCYHLLEQPWFPEGRALIDWLAERGETRLAEWLREDAASGLPLEAVRRRLLRRWRQSRLGRRIREAAEAPPDLRREAGHEVVTRFVRRITHSEPPA